MVELCLLTTYLTLGNSHKFKGQTIGKKILGIKVVDSNGEYLGLIRSFLRSVIPVLLMNSLFIMRYIISEHDNMNSFIYLSLCSLLFATIYFPLLRLNRQTLHDMLVSSQVILKSQTVKISRKTDWFLISTCIIIVLTYLYYALRWCFSSPLLVLRASISVWAHQQIIIKCRLHEQ